VDREPSLEEAIALAARAHRGQRYSSPEAEPYIFHPLRVMLSLADPADQIAAVLHDAIEDTDLELRDLAEAGYPAQIVAAVDSLSHRAAESYEDYINRVATNEIARRVKVADLRENLANNLRLPSSPGNPDRIDRYERALAQLGGELSARPVFVVVSGPPASGKSTLAPVLARELGLPLIAKDTIKDALMSVLPVPDVDTSRQVGRGAVSAMLAVAADSPIGAVIESNFYRSVAVDSLRRLPGSVIEVFCRCDQAVARARYQYRAGTRHAGHFDLVRTVDELWNDEVAGPVAGGWPVLQVDTNVPAELTEVLAFIRRSIT
jgi:predicted kinase